MKVWTADVGYIVTFILVVGYIKIVTVVCVRICGIIGVIFKATQYSAGNL